MLIFNVNVSFENAEQKGWVQKWLLGTWIIDNETADPSFSGYTGQVTFYRYELVIDSGRFAAGGLIHKSESTSFEKYKTPISCKFIGSQHIYLSWYAINSQGNLYPRDALLTIVKRRGNRVTIIGQGGIGRVGVPRISYLEKVSW